MRENDKRLEVVIFMDWSSSSSSYPGMNIK